MKFGLTLCLALLCCGQTLSAQNAKPKKPRINNFLGKWKYEFISQETHFQNNSFTLYLTIDSTKQNGIKGRSCSVTRGGNKVDCYESGDEYNLTGYFKNDTVYFQFKSAFEGKGKARLCMDKTKQKLTWKLSSYSGEHYLPDKEVLKRDTNDLPVFFNNALIVKILNILH